MKLSNELCTIAPELVTLVENCIAQRPLPAALTEKQVAKTGLRSIAALRWDRRHNKGLPRIFLGGLVRYPTIAVLKALSGTDFAPVQK
jgi:hypothetical protein